MLFDTAPLYRRLSSVVCLEVNKPGSQEFFRRASLFNDVNFDLTLITPNSSERAVV